MVQVPPPIHGAALRNLSLVESKIINQALHIKLLPLKFAKNIHDIGKLDISKIYKTIAYFFNLIKTIFVFKPNAAYFTLSPTGFAFYRDCLFVLALKICSVKRMYHLRGLGIYNAYTQSKFKATIYKWAFKGAHVICLSKGHCNDVKGLPYASLHVVQNGLKKELENVVVKEFGDEIELLFFSNYVQSKGVLIFIDICEILINKGYSIKGKLVGANGDLSKEDLEVYITSKKLANKIKVCDGVFGKEKFKVIEASDIFIFPTYYPQEVFPGVVLEAMQCAKPIITTTTGVIPEIIDDGINGLIAHKKDTALFVELAESLINNKKMAMQMGKAAREKYLSSYTQEIFENNVKDTIINVVELN
ncbi:MAG TPA: glycosyltransferase family 4 protein [Chitinophagaceae bacterium]|nr:glycosyltransferase family 4 protein [Chitinophagaceae bacterium]MCC6635789.1 glycosyltransferase family 4 protein [Chitinophagaceae bacterium]HNE92760.1 glycosyltransferase family 4 protein [Chitinophagaceae bacterium]HNM35350.1 glycosyltransferase family 4 protein [Chitinophagaceae bacterium]